MNIFIDNHSRTPIYEQIKEQIVMCVSRGQLKKDEHAVAPSAFCAVGTEYQYR